MPFNDANQIATEVSKRFLAEGKLIEAGFAAFIALSFRGTPDDQQLEQLRVAFFGGAQHLWGTLVNVIDPDAEPTEADLKKMALIQSEMDAFITDFAKRHIPTKGQA